MKITCVATALGSLLVFLLNPIPLLSNDEITQKKSQEILEKIRNKYVPVYKKYRGVQSLQTIISKELEFERVVSTTTVTISRKDYFYDNYPDTVVVKYEKNGNQMKASDYKEGKYLPTFPVFDEKSGERYDTSVTGYEMIEGKKCYRIKVVPKGMTMQYLMGNYYFTVQNLNLVMFDGTLAKLPPACRDYNMKMFFNQQGDIAVVKESTINLRIVIPLLYEGQFSSITTVSQCTPIPY